jgi:hypothetical protein
MVKLKQLERQGFSDEAVDMIDRLLMERRELVF